MFAGRTLTVLNKYILRLLNGPETELNVAKKPAGRDLPTFEI
jgi:hypothetical protein